MRYPQLQHAFEIDDVPTPLRIICPDWPDKIGFCAHCRFDKIDRFKVVSHQLTGFRAWLNLWAVLDYLTKYNAKAGKGSKKLAQVFTEVLEQICEWDDDSGLHDLWRRMIFKCYSRVLGGRDYSLFETMHYGLRLPATISSFGNVKTVSVSNWSSLKHRQQIKFAKASDRVTNYTKLESFDRRALLARAASVEDHELENLSMYAFWRLFDVQKTVCESTAKSPWWR